MKIGDKTYIPINWDKPKKTKKEALKLKERAKDHYPYVRMKKEKRGYIIYVCPGYEKE